jgi:branched-chain amino acid transport system ATP-binding protein
VGSNVGVVALALADVSKSFEGVRAVDSVSLVVPVGQRRALIGPNGAGKTTLFNVIGGELRAESGRIALFGRDVTSESVQSRARLGIGRTYQNSEMFPRLTVEESLYLAAGSGGRLELGLFRPWTANAQLVRRARSVGEQVGLSGVLDTRVGELSHGQQRQLEVGMALAMNPRVLLLDEPASGLSVAERVMLIDVLQSVPRDITTILIEHDVDIVARIADEITVMDRGRVVLEGAPDVVRASEDVRRVYYGVTVV